MGSEGKVVPLKPEGVTADQLKALEQEHGELLRYTVKGVEIVLKLPDEKVADITRQRAVGDPARKAAAQANLVRACIVHPGPAVVDALIKRAPFFLDGIGNSPRFQQWVGLSVEEEEKG